VRLFFVAVGATGLLVVMFFGSMSAQSPAMLFAVLCLWTPVAWLVGYAYARSGARFRAPARAGVEPPAKRQRVNGTEYN